MACLSYEKLKSGKTPIIRLSEGEHPSRPVIRFGRVSKKQAETILRHIESLIACRKTGMVISPSIQDWLFNIPDSLRKRLETIGLIDPVVSGKQFTVNKWTKCYIKQRENDKYTKDDTIRKLENVARRLSSFFYGIKLDEVTVYDAKNFKSFLRGKEKLGENTARRHIGMCRQFFNAAIDKGLINKNPFRGQPVTVNSNESRMFYVTPEMTRKVLDACPNAEWRLIVGLARFGGLRCFSEIHRLKWEDIDFANSEFTVHASKTEKSSTGGIRKVPLFSDLRILLQQAFDQAEAGSVYCITRYRDKNTNLRTQFERIIKRAGLEPWPKLFNNLRSTRATELLLHTKGDFKAVSSWLGHSIKVLMKFYAQVTESVKQEVLKISVFDGLENPVQNPVQNTAESECNGMQASDKGNIVSSSDCKDLRIKTKACDSMRDTGFSPIMGRAGFEPAKAHANGFTARPL